MDPNACAALNYPHHRKVWSNRTRCGNLGDAYPFQRFISISDGVRVCVSDDRGHVVD